ncbi:MAG: ATP-dependent RNA helicase HrpA [Phycisphaerales bacterium]|nr:ATP-dependent RNA helicase HrpA [Planctomycetota bacterium]MCH8509532.1 ATP-dependent RNA helicase HrpA [Phycisphaerales bacterium]
MPEPRPNATPDSGPEPGPASAPTPDRVGGDSLWALLDRAMPADRARFRSRIRGLDRPAKGPGGRRRGGGATAPDARAEAGLRADLIRSVELFEARRASVPRIDYPAELPVSQRRDDLLDMIREHQVVIVCGETGSGKTTQLPKICLELGRGVGAMIGHTQPRRLAARAVAARVGEELGSPGLVASKMRFDDRTDERTLVKVMTDGILLAETRSDPLLRRYDAVIVDEAHERSLNIDFLLGTLRRILPRRPDLKLIITSATIDATRFAEHFAGERGPAPVIEVEGRTYPVELRYESRASLDADAEISPEEHAADAAVRLIHQNQADVLVFMPGEREIRLTAHALRLHPGLPERAEIVPLYARLSPQEQQRVFRPSGNPRIVIATNVAETSLTVPNIRAVVDPGTARIKRYNARSKIDQLLVEPVSQASANQRAGRCGRVAPGVCVRLYDQSDYDARDAYTAPELLRSDLAGVILQMIDLGLGEPAEFPFIDAPVYSRWRDGYDTLRELAAIDEEHRLTEVGKRMAKLPADPRIARMILAGQDAHCLHDVLVIAAAMSVQDPRVRPHEKRDAADQAHAEFRVPGSDFLTLRAIWDFYHDEHKTMSRRKLARACEKRFLSPRRIDEWREVFRQLARLCREMGFDVSPRHAQPDEVHKAILTGLLINIGRKGEQREYQGTRNTKFEIAPGSACSDPKPKWVMGGEIVRTTRVLARTVASVKPEWIERAAEHLVRRTHTDPRWDPQTGRVVADEKVTFEGLELVPKRVVHYGPIDPAEARRIFIHHALVEGEMETRSKGVRDNRRLEARLNTLAAKARRADFIAESEARFAFYDARLPADVCTVRAFERWATKAEAGDPGVLRMREEDLLLARPDIAPEAFPDEAEVFGTRLRIRYALSPGEAEDGATIRVTPEELHRLTPERVEWLVPGFLPERVWGLVRTLPKDIRRRFDLEELAERVAPKLRPGEGPVAHQVARLVSAEAGVPIRADQLRAASLPEHLRPRFEVVDPHGKVLDHGRDLEQLRTKFEADAHAAVRTVSAGHETPLVTPENFAGLPESVEIERSRGKKVVAFPALVLEGASVAQRMRPTPWQAERETRVGMAALFGQVLKREIRVRVRQLPGYDRLALHAAPHGLSNRLETIVLTRAASVLCVEDRPPVRTPEDFRRRCAGAWDQAVPVTQEIISLLAQCFDGLSRLRARVADGLPEPWRHARADIDQQLRLLTPEGWETSVPTRWLRCYPRYLRAVEVRLERLRSIGPQRDLQQTRLVYAWLEKLVALARSGVEQSPAANGFEELRWMVEEYRVACFAQELGTAVKVSERRLEEAHERVAAGRLSGSP